MIRLTVVTLAALYAILYFFGDPSRRTDEPVSRAEAPSLGLATLASYLPDLPADATIVEGRVSDGEAIRLALEAGEKARSEREKFPRRGAVVLASADASDPVGATAATSDMWYVTGERVNLRQGPGTTNPVVGQATFGMAAEVLEDRDGWYRIRLADGSGDGWIFGRFLNENQPG